MGKIGVNEKCPCKSGLKYKKCCMQFMFDTKWTTGQSEPSSLKCQILMEALHQAYPKFRFINITNNLKTADDYKDFLTKNYFTNIAMIAEKTEGNSKIFETRINNSKSDVMVMYRGSYRTFPSEQINTYIESLESLLKIENDA